MFDDDCQKRQDWLTQYPCDVDHKFLQFPGTTEGRKEDPSFFWAPPGVKSTEGKGLDSQFLKMCIRDRPSGIKKLLLSNNAEIKSAGNRICLGSCDAAVLELE